MESFWRVRFDVYRSSPIYSERIEKSRRTEMHLLVATLFVSSNLDRQPSVGIKLYRYELIHACHKAGMPPLKVPPF